MQHFPSPLAFEEAGTLSEIVTGFQEVPYEIVTEIARLHHAGFSLIALGDGEDGKQPRGSVAGGRWPLRRVLGAMRGGTMYGIRLDGLVVIDIDTDTREAHEYVERRFGASPVQVSTARGVHHYYRLGDQVPPAGVHLPGIDIDVKSGVNSYVVGPGSIRPDIGVFYTAIGNALAFDLLPDFIDREPLPRDLRGLTVETGQRNDHLFRQACQFAHDAESQDNLFGQLIAQRDFEIDDPESFPDSEVAKIAKSVWGYREAGNLWAGRNSTYRINNRMLLDSLVSAGETDAFALYHLLAANHGHLNRPFNISPKSMSQARLWGRGRDTLYNARNVLLEKGLIKKAKGYQFILTTQSEWRL